MNSFVKAALRSQPITAPTNTELVQIWREHYTSVPHEHPILPVQGLVGAVTARPTTQKQILSIDLCEVIRKTHVAYALAMGHDESHIGGVVWSYNGHGIDGLQHLNIITTLINEGKVEPTEEIDAIRDSLLRLRETTLIIANTSSGEGTEQATVDFLNTHLPGCFDGILFPRNYDGTSAMTKGLALKNVLRTLGIKDAKVIHIDDAPHHHISILSALRKPEATEISTIMPVFQPGANAVNRQVVIVPEGVTPATTVTEAFNFAVDRFLKSN